MLDDPETPGIISSGITNGRWPSKVRRHRVEALADFRLAHARCQVAIGAHGVIVAGTAANAFPIAKVGRGHDAGGGTGNRPLPGPSNETVNQGMVGLVSRNIEAATPGHGEYGTTAEE